MRAWFQAARPLAQVNVAVPLVLGQAAAWRVTGRFDPGWLAVAVGWGILDHLFVVLANDFADRESDSVSRTLISGGSGAIVEGKLSSRQVGRAACWAAIALLLYSCALGALGRAWTPLYALAALLLLWLYSFPPARLSYRGGGEVLQGIGVGIGLPSLGYYLQTESPFAPVWVLAPATLLGVCGNVLTALPDVEDDQKANKRTYAVRRGTAAARRFASAGIAFAAFGVVLWTPSISLAARTTVAVTASFPLIAGAGTRSPLRAAWWGNVGLVLTLVVWTLALALGF